MNADFVITVLILGSTIFAVLRSLLTQRQHHWKDGLNENFATLFLVGLGIFAGTYLAMFLSYPFNRESVQFFLSGVGGIIGLLVTHFYIVPKIVIPKFRQASHGQEEPTPPPSSPPES